TTAGYRSHVPGERAGMLGPIEETVSRRAIRLVEAYAPAYVVIDEHQDVLHFSGRTGKYIQPAPGAASLNIFNLLETSLRPEVRSTLHKAMTTGEKVVRENVLLPFNGGAAKRSTSSSSRCRRQRA